MQKEGGLNGQPRRVKPDLGMGISGRSGLLAALGMEGVDWLTTGTSSSGLGHEDVFGGAAQGAIIVVPSIYDEVGNLSLDPLYCGV